MTSFSMNTTWFGPTVQAIAGSEKGARLERIPESALKFELVSVRVEALIRGVQTDFQ